MPTVLLRVNQVLQLELKLEAGKPGEYQRYFISAKDREVRLRTEGQETRRFKLETDLRGYIALGLADNGGPAEYMNIYVRAIGSRGESTN